jgi:hypothetical protein
MDALLVGTKQILPVTHTRYGHCVAVQFDDNFEVFEQNRPPVLVMTKSYSSKHIKKKLKKNNAVAVCSSGGIFD